MRRTPRIDIANADINGSGEVKLKATSLIAPHRLLVSILGGLAFFARQWCRSLCCGYLESETNNAATPPPRSHAHSAARQYGILPNIVSINSLIGPQLVITVGISAAILRRSRCQASPPPRCISIRRKCVSHAAIAPISRLQGLAAIDMSLGPTDEASGYRCLSCI